MVTGFFVLLNTTEPSDAAQRGRWHFGGKWGGVEVTPPSKGLGFIVTHVRRYEGEHVHPTGKHLQWKCRRVLLGFMAATG